MPDDKAEAGKQDRSRVSAEVISELQYVAKAAGVSVVIAREMIWQAAKRA